MQFAKIINLWKWLDALNKRKIIFILFLSLIGAFLEMISVGLLFPLIGIIIEDSNGKFLSNISLDEDTFKALVLSSFVIFFILKNILLSGISYLNFKFSTDIRHHFSKNLFSRYLNLKYKLFTNDNSSEKSKNLTILINQLNTNVLTPLVVFITDLLLVLLLFLLAMYLDFNSTIILLLLVLIPSFLYFNLVKNKMKKYGMLNQNYESKRIKLINESFSLKKEIDIYKKNEFFINQYKQIDLAITDTVFKNIYFNQLSKFFIEIFFIVAILIFLIVNILKNQDLLLMIPLLGFYAFASFKITPSINRIMNAIQSLKFSEKIIDILNSELTYSVNDKKKNISRSYTFNKLISIEELSFSYDRVKVFENLSFTIKKGEMIGVIGESGSGKSTLVNLILNLYQPTNGKITIDGNDIKDFALKNIFGLVPQDIILLDDSIEKNIAFGEARINRKKINKILNECNLKNFINNLEHGLKTIVGERGINLSGGQKQRIIIARALYKNAKVLIFDEATSALDLENEKEIIRNISLLKNKYTIIIITHRTSILKHCDKNYQIKNKNITLLNQIKN